MRVCDVWEGVVCGKVWCVGRCGVWVEGVRVEGYVGGCVWECVCVCGNEVS